MNIFKDKLFYMVLGIILLGGFLRFFGNTNNPVSLNIDEVAYGYNAYSILKTGQDEYGEKFPLTFKSVGDYKPPVPVYLMVPSIAIFGLNEFGVRFTAAFLSSLAIGFYFIFFNYLTKNKKYALFGTLLLAISPWDIYYARYATTEFISSTLLVAITVYSLMKIKDTGRLIWSILGALTAALSMYAYHSERLFVPLFILTFFIFFFKALKNRAKNLLIFGAVLLLLLVPLILSTISGPDKSRFQATFITNDINFTRQVIVDSVQDQFTGNALMFFHWVRKYLAYFQPSFLFYNGLNMTLDGSLGLGVLYLFELPFLILGLIALGKNKIPNKLVIVAWVLLGLLPASLTVNEQHPSRTHIIMPMVMLICGIGLTKLINFNFGKYKKGILAVFTIFIIWNLTIAFLIFAVHFPNQRGEAFMEGTKETVQYALAHKSQYREIVFDPYRGVEGPYIVSIPHMYILFYSAFDPASYQKIEKQTGLEYYHFDKFTVRKINWPADKNKKGTLFIGSPWSLPENELKQSQVLQKVYLTNGRLAFLIVTP